MKYSMGRRKLKDFETLWRDSDTKGESRCRSLTCQTYITVFFRSSHPGLLSCLASVIQSPLSSILQITIIFLA